MLIYMDVLIPVFNSIQYFPKVIIKNIMKHAEEIQTGQKHKRTICLTNVNKETVITTTTSHI